jgi:CRISPR locus-related DNA-binding protein
VQAYRKVVITSVGHAFERPYRAISRTGIGVGDVVILVNSFPISQQARSTMEKLKTRISKVYFNVFVEEVWLDPRNRFEDNVATLRKIVERYAPHKVSILAVGGFRWLNIALMYLAQVLQSIALIKNVIEISFELELEEDTMSKEVIEKFFPTQESRVVKILSIPKLVELSATELRILEVISSGKTKVKQILEALKELDIEITRPTLQRKLRQLVRKGLITYTPKGKSYSYSLTPLGKLFT